MKQIEVTEEDYEQLAAFASRLNISVGDWLHGLAEMTTIRTSSDAIAALYEAHKSGGSWYLLRQGGPGI